MSPVRKIIGLLIIIFIGLPILCGVIWTVGIARGALSPEFISDLPREIIMEIPEIVDEIFEEGKSADVVQDDNARAWFEAASKVGKTPKELMEEIGFLDWLENELSASFREVGEILRGERGPREVVFDLRPLKEALQHEAIDAYVLAVLGHLPPCNERELEEWEDATFRDVNWTDLPACQPDLALAQEVLRNERLEAVFDMPDEVEVLEDVRYVPFGLYRWVVFFSYFLFLIPVFFLFLAALIAAGSPGGFFRWSGIPILIGGLASLLLSLFSKNIVPLALSWSRFVHSDYWSADLQDLIIEKVGWIPVTVTDYLFSPVINVAVIVSVVGVVLIGISFLVRNKKK
jgi:hypothetical protein